MQNYPTNKNKWHLLLCELHFPTIHGKTNDSHPNIETHYLVYDIYDPITKSSLQNTETETETEDDESLDSNDNILSQIDNDIYDLKHKYLLMSRYFHTWYKYKHPTIRNYHNIISNPDYIKPEIGEYIILPTQEAITILKTIWIRIIQKKWKKVFVERNEIIKERCKLQSLKVRKNTGYWPTYCNKLPGLRGMLSALKK